MRYQSTRGAMAPQTFSQILLGGLADDGGLVVPESYPRIDAATLASWRASGYRDLAFEILRRYADDLGEDALRDLVDRTYTAELFGSPEITPLVELEPGLHLLQLSNGPTLAFKDLAMQLLGNLFEHVLARTGRQLNIVGATSGDTGSAAEYAMRGKTGVRVFMLSPHGRMSAFQRAQMYTLDEPNIFNVAVLGVFDECQDMVKAVASDLAFKNRWSIGAVNSINWARVVAQVVYYFKAWLAITGGDGSPVSFAVPSGNFGNVLAGHIARSMGLPVSRLVVATNENDVLDEFFRTGRYRTRSASQTHQTSSPSMDISKASNFERFVFDLVDRDANRVAGLWQALERDGEFDLSGSEDFRRLASFGMVSGRSSHADRLATIRAVHARHGRLVDPHTADGLKVAAAWREPGVPMICLETALPVKFAETINEALGVEPAVPERFRDLAGRAQHFTLMPADSTQLKRYIAGHCRAAS